MTQSSENRIDRIEIDVASLFSAQRNTQALLNQLAQAQLQTQANLNQMSARVDEFSVQVQRLSNRTDEVAVQVQRLSNRVDEFVFQAQRLFTQQGGKLEIVEGQGQTLEAMVRYLARDREEQRSQFQEFQRTTNATLERFDRILDFLMRQQQGGNS